MKTIFKLTTIFFLILLSSCNHTNIKKDSDKIEQQKENEISENSNLSKDDKLVQKTTYLKDTRKDTALHEKIYSQNISYDSKIYYNIAREFHSKKDYKNAIINYKKSISEDKNNVDSYDNLGLVYRAIGDYENAIKNYKKSIELYPQGRIAHQNLAIVYKYQKKYKEAIKEYQKIIEYYPNNAEGYYGLGYVALTSNSMHDLGIENGKKALSIYKENHSPLEKDAYLLIGLLYYQKKDNVNAKKYLQIAERNGAQIPNQVYQEIFGKSNNQLRLETDADFKRYESAYIKACAWLLNTPIGIEKEKREAFKAFTAKWTMGVPYIKIVIAKEATPFADSPELFLTYMNSLTIYVIGTKDSNRLNGVIFAVETTLKFYKKNRGKLKKHKKIEELIKLRKEGKLHNYLKELVKK